MNICIYDMIGLIDLLLQVSTEPASRRSLRTLQVGNMQTKKDTMKCIVLSNQYDHYLG